tara:strand:- start:969 stop:1439 length:471 start_codon:yes stop_codon:yes gene_type:complete
MPLVKGSTYDGVFYDYVLDGIRDLFISEFGNAKVYIAPEISHADNFQIKLWGPSSTTEETGADFWQREYNVDIALYMIEKNAREAFYKQFYGDVERLYQVLHNNRTLTKTVNSKSLTLLAGEVSDIDINDFQGDEDNIDGLNVARLSFSCFVLRSQ